MDGDTFSLEIINGFVDAIHGGHWSVIVAVALMIAAFLSRKLLLPIIPKEDTDLFVMGVAMVLSVAAGLYKGVDPVGAVLSGLLIGGAAIGFWEAAGKRLRDWFVQWWKERKAAKAIADADPTESESAEAPKS